MKTRIRQLTEQEKRSLGEQQMIADWLQIFPKGILSIVSDTFDLWKLITEYLPANKEAIMNRDGKLVVRPDSGDPVDIICGFEKHKYEQKMDGYYYNGKKIEGNIDAQYKGAIELLWDIFGGTVNEQGYKVLDPHIGAIYGDSITPERQRQIYERLAAKGFAATNIVLGVGSFTYQYNTRDTLGFAAKGAWFEVEVPDETCGGDLRFDSNNRKWYKSYNIYKDPVTDDGTKKSLKGLLAVHQSTAEDMSKGEYGVKQECTPDEEAGGLLQVIYEDGKFYNFQTLEQIRKQLLCQ